MEAETIIRERRETHVFEGSLLDGLDLEASSDDEKAGKDGMIVF